MTITVVGGGLAGLIAAVECAERGEDVELFEATSLLGGRARSTTGEFVANHGPHVVYGDGELWRWLGARGLATPAKKPPLHGARIRYGGALHHTPPVAALRALRVFRDAAPDELSLREWVTRESGPDVADAASRMCHVFTFDHDPGRLAASFCAERARRAYSLPLSTRYVVGGWGVMIERIAGRARSLGVRITLGARIDTPPDGPVIVAVPPASARRLLGDDSLRWTGTRTAILDIGVRTRRGDPFIVLDLDDGVFLERFTAADRTLAPVGHQLVQAQVGLAPDEGLDDGVTRIERVLDVAFADWRAREVWRRRYVLEDASGALDPPGTTWRDRPAIDRGDGVYLCGDMVAAPGLLSEVSVNSAVTAAQLASSAHRSEITERSSHRSALDPASPSSSGLV
jgi:phytoene dehydrogenase-like protein